MGTKAWVIGMGAAVSVAAVYFALLNTGRDLEERDQLAAKIAGLDGSEICNIAWIKAGEAGIADGRTPSIYAPEVRVVGPPRVLACGMIREGGKDAEPLLIYERCRDLNRRCVEFVN